MNHIQSFKLSSQGRIASAVSMALVLPLLSVTALADNIRPVAKSQTTVSQVGQVDVVNIANPNAKGLSHNQYRKFNVGEAGAVLNNSLTSGQSQLAGQLEGNSNLTGTASVILNEVVSKNPSLLLGQQEVFGMAADYVLANPNGINSTGGGFINTNRASLVVGKPNIVDERLASFTVGDRNNKSLTLTGDVSGSQRLDLLAPKVDIQGNIEAADAINVITGRKNIDYDTLQISDLQRSQPKLTLDGQILGSMQAGRIRIHNTDTKATQTLQGQFTASDEVRATAGNLKVVDSRIAGGDVDLTATDKLYIGGEVQTSRTDAEVNKQKLEDNVTLTNSGYQENQAYQGSTVTGDAVRVAGAEVTVEGSELQGDSVKALGGRINITGVTTTDTVSETARNSKGLWFNETENLDKTEQYHQSSLVAKDKVQLNSALDTNIVGTKLSADSVAIDTGNSLQLSGAVTENSQSQINRYKRETAALKSGTHDITTAVGTVHTTDISARDVALNSKGEQRLEGVQIAADTATLQGSKDLSLTAAQVSDRQTDTEDFKYWGGIGGGETHIDNKQQTTLVGSQIKADKATLSSDANLTVSGSQLQGTQSLDLTAKDSLNISHDFASEQDYAEDRHGTAFNITDKKQATDRLAQTTVASQLTGANVQLTGDNITVAGSDVTATQALTATAQTALNTQIANATDITKTEEYDLTSEGKANLNVDLNAGLAGLKDANFEASGSLKGVTTLTTTGTGEGRGNTLSANTAQLTAQQVDLQGSNIQAAAGATVRGEQVTIGAGEALVNVDSKVVKATGPEAYIRGGASGIEVGVSIGTNQVINEHNEYQAINSNISAADKLSVQAEQNLTTQGTQLSAADVDLAAQDIVNSASYDRVVDRQVLAGGDAALNAYAGTSTLVGGNVSLSGDGIGKTTEVKTAHTTGIHADNTVNIAATNTALDAGTQIDAQAIDIHADDYTGTSAYNSTVTTTHSGRGDVAVSASSTTLADVTIGASGRGEYQYTQTGDAQAVKGSLKAQSVTIAADSKAVAAQDVTANRYQLTAGEEAIVGQDADKQWTTAGGTVLGGSVGLTVVPATAAAGAVVGAPSFSGEAAMNYLSIEDDQAKAAKITANEVTVSADQLAQVTGATLDADTVIIQGNRANIAAAQDTHKAVGVNLDGKGAFSLNIVDSLVTGSDDIGAGAQLGVINETRNQAHGATVHAEDVTVVANGEGDALSVEGANIDAKTVSLTNTNEAGNVALVAAESRSQVGNVGIGGNLTATAKQSAETGKSSFDSDSQNAHLDIESDNSYYYALGTVNADKVVINAGHDATVQSNVNAGTLQTTAGNQLSLSSAQDVVRKVTVTTQLAVDGSPIQFVNKVTEGGVLNVLKDDFNNGTILGVSASGKAGFDVDHQQVTHQANIQAQSLDTHAGNGDIAVTAAKVDAVELNLNGATVNNQDNNDFVHKVAAEVEGKTFSIPGFVESIPSLVEDAFAGKPLDLPVHADISYEWDDTDGSNTKASVNGTKTLYSK